METNQTQKINAGLTKSLVKNMRKLLPKKLKAGNDYKFFLVLSKFELLVWSQFKFFLVMIQFEFLSFFSQFQFLDFFSQFLLSSQKSPDG